MKRVLLLSNSKLAGQKPLEWCQRELKEHLEGIEEILFVPWALADHDGYEEAMTRAFEPMGIRLRSIHHAPSAREAVESASALFVGGGNTFRLLDRLQREELLEPVRDRVEAGEMVYTGSSAGSNVACPTIMTTNDMPIVEPRSFESLGLIGFQINPHYLDPDTSSIHQGETREERIRQYLEEHEGPVLGLREGCWLRAEGDWLETGGLFSSRLFTREFEPREIPPGPLWLESQKSKRSE